MNDEDGCILFFCSAYLVVCLMVIFLCIYNQQRDLPCNVVFGTLLLLPFLHLKLSTRQFSVQIGLGIVCLSLCPVKI